MFSCEFWEVLRTEDSGRLLWISSLNRKVLLGTQNFQTPWNACQIFSSILKSVSTGYFQGVFYELLAPKDGTPPPKKKQIK